MPYKTLPRKKGARIDKIPRWVLSWVYIGGEIRRVNLAINHFNVVALYRLAPANLRILYS